MPHHKMALTHQVKVTTWPDSGGYQLVVSGQITPAGHNLSLYFPNQVSNTPGNKTTTQ